MGYELLILLCALIGPAFCGDAPPVPPRNDAWRILGMGGGGTIVDPHISPHDPKVIVCRCDMTGGYISKDGGDIWRMFNLRTGIGSFAFDPKDPKVIYAGNVGLWRSDDTGDTWHLIWPDPAKTKEFCRDDHGEYILQSEDPLYPKNTDEYIEAIMAGRNRDDEKWCWFVYSGSLYELTSNDKALLAYNGLKYPALALSSSIFNLTVATEAGGMMPVTKAGGKREWIGDLLPPEHIQFVCVADSNSGQSIHYALTQAKWENSKLVGGIHVSNRRTETPEWKSAIGNFEKLIYKVGEDAPPRFISIACCQNKPDIVYVSFAGLRLGEGPDQLYNGIAKSTDAGKTWEIVHKESTHPSDNMEISWLEPRMRQGDSNLWFDSARGLAVAPTDPDFVIATDCFRVYRTRDGGKHWQQVNSAPIGKPEEKRWTSRGLDVTNCYGIVFDPFDLQHVFLPQTDMGLFHSHDLGASWEVATDGVPDHWKNTTYWVVPDPDVKDLVWGAFSYAHDLPRNKMWRNGGTGNFEGGVCVSTDGAKTWKLSNEGMPQTACTHILLDPKSPAGARTLYACGFGRGVFKSTDNGKTWRLKNEGIDKKDPLAWRLTRADDGTLYLIVARRDPKKPLGGDGDGAIYKSLDGAEHWSKVAMPDGSNFPMGISVDPGDMKHLYLACWGVFSMDGDTGGGVFESRDGGAAWKNVFSEGQHSYDVTIDPKNPKTLYVCGFNSGAWRSTDSGATWQRIKGYNFKWGQRVVVDPNDAEKIYISTFGGGLWHGPAAGDPNSREDGATPLPRK